MTQKGVRVLRTDDGIKVEYSEGTDAVEALGLINYAEFSIRLEIIESMKESGGQL